MTDLAAADFPPELRARFRPLRKLGAGGMGMVFLAEEPALGRQVAIKLVLDARDPALAERLVREAQNLARVEHPHVVRVYSAGTTSMGPYLVLEYLDGTSLQQVTRPIDLLGVFLQVAEGLQAVHSHGIVHRDVKPSNVVLTRDDRAVLVDFGLARGAGNRTLTRTGAVVGTLGFLPPEAVAGRECTPAGDWFGWGATLYVAIEGVLPFTTPELMAMSRGTAVPPRPISRPEIEAPVRALLERCLAADPERRPRGPEEIRDLLAGPQGSDPRPTVPVTMTRTFDRSLLEALAAPPEAEPGGGARTEVTAAFPPLAVPLAPSMRPPWWEATPARRRFVKLYLPVILAWVSAAVLGWWLLRSRVPPEHDPPAVVAGGRDDRNLLQARERFSVEIRSGLLEVLGSSAWHKLVRVFASDPRSRLEPGDPGFGAPQLPTAEEIEVLSRTLRRLWVGAEAHLALEQGHDPPSVPFDASPLLWDLFDLALQQAGIETALLRMASTRDSVTNRFLLGARLVDEEAVVQAALVAQETLYSLGEIPRSLAPYLDLGRNIRLLSTFLERPWREGPHWRRGDHEDALVTRLAQVVAGDPPGALRLALAQAWSWQTEVAAFYRRDDWKERVCPGIGRILGLLASQGGPSTLPGITAEDRTGWPISQCGPLGPAVTGSTGP